MAGPEETGLQVRGLSVWYEGVIRAIEDVSFKHLRLE